MELKHYGVPGMRWGHRKGPGKTAVSKQKNTDKEDEQPKNDRAKKRKRAIKIGAAAVAGVLSIAGAIKVSKMKSELKSDWGDIKNMVKDLSGYAAHV